MIAESDQSSSIRPRDHREKLSFLFHMRLKKQSSQPVFDSSLSEMIRRWVENVLVEAFSGRALRVSPSKNSDGEGGGNASRVWHFECAPRSDCYTMNDHRSITGWVPPAGELLKPIPRGSQVLTGFCMIGQWAISGGNSPPALVQADRSCR